MRLVHQQFLGTMLRRCILVAMCDESGMEDWSIEASDSW